MPQLRLAWPSEAVCSNSNAYYSLFINAIILGNQDFAEGREGLGTVEQCD